jgi:hypothetical protein
MTLDRTDITAALDNTDLDDEEFEALAWIRQHPAWLNALAVAKQANFVLWATCDLLLDEWEENYWKENKITFPDEGARSPGFILKREEDDQEEHKKLRVDLLSAIAKYGVKVPARKTPLHGASAVRCDADPPPKAETEAVPGDTTPEPNA